MHFTPPKPGNLQDAQNRFLQHATARLRRQYRAVAEGVTLHEPDRARLSGFMEAGLSLQLATRDELNEMIEAVHLEELGETVEERRRRKSQEWPAEQPDYSRFDEPAFERRSLD